MRTAKSKAGGRTSGRRKIITAATGGAAATGAGALGAFGICHAACQVLIVGLAFFGITISGMPLAFLMKPKYYIPLLVLGALSMLLSVYLWSRTRR